MAKREAKPRKELSITLTAAQQKEIKEFAGITCDRWIIPPDVASHLFYGMPGAVKAHTKLIKLTAAQQNIIKKEFGVTCEVAEMTKELATRIHKC